MWFALYFCWMTLVYELSEFLTFKIHNSKQHLMIIGHPLQATNFAVISFFSFPFSFWFPLSLTPCTTKLLRHPLHFSPTTWPLANQNEHCTNFSVPSTNGRRSHPPIPLAFRAFLPTSASPALTARTLLLHTYPVLPSRTSWDLHVTDPQDITHSQVRIARDLSFSIQLKA